MADEEQGASKVPGAPGAKPTVGRTAWDFGFEAIGWVFPKAGAHTRRFVQVGLGFAVAAAIGIGLWTLLKPSAPPSVSITNNGGIVGPVGGGTQNNTFSLGERPWPNPSPEDRRELIRHLQSLPSERFFVVASPHAMAAAQQLFSDLTEAHWVAVPIGHETQASVIQNAGAPSVYGVSVSAVARTAAVEYLGQWCRQVGLQTGPVVSVDTSKQLETVDVNFGDPPR